MVPSFNNYIQPNKNKLTTNLNNNKLTKDKFSFKNLLEVNLKGLNTYNKNLNLYISKWNNKNLILNIKKEDPMNKLELKFKPLTNLNVFPISNKINYKGKSELIYNKSKQTINNYLESITYKYIYNSTKDKLFNYAQEINYSYNSNKNLIKNIYIFLFYSFVSMNSLISRPVFEVTNEKVIIHLFFYLLENKKMNINNPFIKLNRIKLNIICKILSHFFNKPVELDLIRLYYPYFDSNIFVNLLSILINKIQFRIIMQHFFKKAIIKNPNKMTIKNSITITNTKIPSFLSGIHLKIGGRLMTHRVVPKQTNKIIRKGALARGKINFLDKARYTNKNKRGAFSITISIGHYLT